MQRSFQHEWSKMHKCQLSTEGMSHALDFTELLMSLNQELPCWGISKVLWEVECQKPINLESNLGAQVTLKITAFSAELQVGTFVYFQLFLLPPTNLDIYLHLFKHSNHLCDLFLI